MADVDHPVAPPGRGGAVRHVGGVRHHRMAAAEPVGVAVLGEDQVDPALGHPLGPAHCGGHDRPERAGQPCLGAQRGRGVLVHIPHGRRAPAHQGQHKQQFGVVHDEQIGTLAEPGELTAGGAQRTGPAAARRPGHVGGGQPWPGPQAHAARGQRRDVADLMPGVQHGTDLPVQDPRILRVVDDGADNYAHACLTEPLPAGSRSGPGYPG